MVTSAARLELLDGDVASASENASYAKAVTTLDVQDLRSDRQPEFTQLDMEMAFMDQAAIMALTERLIAAVFREVRHISTPLSSIACDIWFWLCSWTHSSALRTCSDMCHAQHSF